MFYSLLGQLIVRQSVGVENWFHSDVLREKVMAVAHTVCEESLRNTDEDHIQQGWDILTLVLSAGIDRGETDIIYMYNVYVIFTL